MKTRPRLSKKTPISQYRLKRLEDLEISVQAYNGLRHLLRSMLSQGHPIQPGPRTISLREDSITRINWRQEFIKACGEDAAKEVTRAHLGNSSRYTLVHSKV